MFGNKQTLIGIYGSSAPNVPTATQITGFTVTTTSGDVLVEWGDGTANTLSSGVSASHNFFCPDKDNSTGFWNSIPLC